MRTLRLRQCRPIAAALLAVFTYYHAVPAVAAASLSPPQAVRAEDLATVQQALEHKIARQLLTDYGVSEAEVEQLLARLSDAELHELASQSERLAYGAGDGAVVILLVVAIALLILLLLGKRIIIR